MNEVKKEVNVPTYKEKVSLGLSYEEWIRRCYEINKDSQCFRERNGHSLCVLCPKNEERTEKTAKRQTLEPSRSLTIEGEIKEKNEISSAEISVPKKPIVKVSVPKKLIAKTHRTRSVKISVPEIPVARILSRMSKIAERAAVSEETQKLATEILHQAKEKHISIDGKNTNSLAAAILWIACQQTNEGKKQEEIAGAARVSKNTISNNSWYLRLKLGLPKPKR